MTRQRERLLTVCLALALFSCSERSVLPDEIPGVWKITVEPRAYEVGRVASSLILKRDGAFEARELPGVIWGQNGRLITGAGTWIYDEDSRFVRLDLLRATVGDDVTVPYGTQLYASQSRYGPHLDYFIGDPDETWNTIEFSRSTQVTR